MGLRVGAKDVCSVKQKGRQVAPGNVGLIPAPPPTKGVPLPTVVTIDTGKPKSGRTTKVKHNGADANNAKTVFAGTKGDPMHLGSLPPGIPKKDVVSWVKEKDGFTVSGHPTAKAQKKGFVTAGDPAMSNADGKKSQSAGPWMAAGGDEMFDADCRAAMIRCGIDPDAFDSYKGRADAQDAARTEWENEQKGRFRRKDPDKWKDPASQAELERMASEGKAGQWVAMNSQSGHLIQNNFFQADREKAKICSNHGPTYDTDHSTKPPTRRMTSTGGYCYDGDKALCTDHMAGTRIKDGGCASVRRGGHEHQEICNSEGRQRADIRRAPEDGGTRGVVGSNDIYRNAVETARPLVNGTADTRRNSPQGLKAGSPEAERAALTDRARQLHAQELADPEGKSKKAKGARGASGGSSSSPSSQPAQIDRDLAVMCIATAAEASLYEQRNEAVTNASTPIGPASASSKKAALEEYNRQHPPGEKRFEDLPTDWRRYARQKDRQKELSKLNADGPEAGNPHPTQKECMEYQANVLFEERLKKGGLPPMGGHVGPGPVSAPAVRGAGGANSGVDRLA